MDPNNFMLDPQLAEQGLNMDNMTFDELCSMTDDMVGNTNTDTTTNDFGMDMPADNTFQTAPMMGPEPDVPADNYDPMENLWYNAAPPMAPGAAYSKTLGWHYKVRYGHTGPSMSLPQSAVGPSPVSGYSTPMAAGGQIPYPYAQTPQERIPVAYPMQVPQLQTPQPPQRPARREAPTSGAAPKQKKTESRQTSIYRACVCSQPGKKAKVKRPRNMFILYRGAHAERIAKELGLRGKQQDISRIVSERWRNETPEIRAEFAELARIEAENHAAANPGYVYRPGTNDSAKFGDESCTCGAYAANVEYNKTENRVKRAKERIEKEAAAEEEDLPEYDPFASQAGSKRKRASNKSASHGNKRPMRSTRSSNSYRELEEDDIFSPVVPSEEPTRMPTPVPAAAPAPAPVFTTAPGFAPGLALPGRRRTPPVAIMTAPTADSPAQHTRAAEERRSTASAASGNSEEIRALFEEFTQTYGSQRSSLNSPGQSSPTRRSLRILKQEQE